MTKDVWKAEELGLSPNSAASLYHIKFSNINPDWLRHAVKQFVLYQSNTRSLSTCKTYIVSLARFSQFIVECAPTLSPNEIDRALLLDYIYFVNQTKLRPASKNIAIVNLRTFIEMTASEEWLPLPKERMLFERDIPKIPTHNPRFIPESVMEQLQKHLPSLPEHYRRVIFVLQETGRRVSEICTLKFDCLRQDESGDYFLFVDETKTKKSYMIPITQTCAGAIKEQQEYVRTYSKGGLHYLFLSEKKHIGQPHAKARIIHKILNDLAREKDIRGPTGEIWKFSAHQFRHTIGTRMINAGVSQHIIQRYLGHKSPQMTSRYAYIHDKTLKEAFSRFQGTMVNIHGKAINSKNEQSLDEQWLKRNVMAQTLPNGYCGLPLIQQRCPHANACLSCASFRTDASFLPIHEKQLDETNRVLHVAQENGWQRQAEMNQEIKINLETIIASLKEKRI